MKNSKYFLVLFLIVISCCSKAQVCPTYTNSLPIRTGYNYSNGSMLANGTDDQFWTVTNDNVAITSEPRKVKTVAFLTSPSLPACNGLVGAQGGGIGISSPGANVNTNTFVVEYRFCLNQLNNINLSLNYLADDQTDVYLNGNYLGTGGMSVISNVQTSNQSFFINGNNTLKFVVKDLFFSSTWLQVDGTITSNGFCVYYPTCNGSNSNLVFNGDPHPFNNIPVFNVCTNQNFNVGVINTTLNNNQYIWNWDLGDATTQTGASISHAYTSPGYYKVVANVQTLSCFLLDPLVFYINVTNCPIPSCDKCIGSFAPTPGNYIISCWVKEDRPIPATTYNFSGVKVSFNGDPTVYGPFFPNVSKNKIINGWQRIEERFTVPPAAIDMKIALINTSGSTSTPYECYFDDIRIHPVDGNMKTYVYDPITLRLVAELDENNFATLYEYDEEGKLIRVKKETEKGIMTIKETRMSQKKQ